MGFEDRASLTFVNRRMPVPAFTVCLPRAGRRSHSLKTGSSSCATSSLHSSSPSRRSL